MATPQYHPATYTLQAVIDRSNALERELARLLGLNSTDYRALSVLTQLAREGSVTMGHLATALGTTPATTSAIVDRLERAGYAVRQRAETDRRQVTLEPTALGWTRLMEIMRPLIADSDAYLRSLPDAQADVVADFLTAVVDQLGHHLTILSDRPAEHP